MTQVRLGLAGGLIPRDAEAVTPARARRLADLGVRAIVAHFQNPPDTLRGALASHVRDVLQGEGLHLSQVTGYNPNLVHPDDDRRTAELMRLHSALQVAADLGAEMVITGCGSLHPTFFYGPHADNHREETRERLVRSLREAAHWAADAGVTLALECHVLTTLDTAEHIRGVLDGVASPWVVANYDPVNLIGDLPTLYDNGPALLRSWRLGGQWWSRRSMHLKDIRPQPELVVHLAETPPGTGLLDYAAVFAVCRELDDGAALIVEHLDDADVAAALAWVRMMGECHGLTFM